VRRIGERGRSLASPGPVTRRLLVSYAKAVETKAVPV